MEKEPIVVKTPPVLQEVVGTNNTYYRIKRPQKPFTEPGIGNDCPPLFIHPLTNDPQLLDLILPEGGDSHD